MRPIDSAYDRDMTDPRTRPRHRQVTLGTRTVGQQFATVGQVYQDGAVIYEAHTFRPFGYISAALNDVRRWAEDEGFVVCEKDR